MCPLPVASEMQQALPAIKLLDATSGSQAGTPKESDPGMAHRLTGASTVTCETSGTAAEEDARTLGRCFSADSLTCSSVDSLEFHFEEAMHRDPEPVDSDLEEELTATIAAVRYVTILSGGALVQMAERRNKEKIEELGCLFLTVNGYDG